jgi:alpha-L-fucosidase 2
MPLASLEIARVLGLDGYRRQLDLATGVHTVTASGRVERTVASAPHGVIAIDSLGDLAIALRTPLVELGRLVSSDRIEIDVRFPSDVPPPFETDYPAATWSNRDGDALQAVIQVRWVANAGRTLVLVAAETTFAGLGRPLGTLDEARRLVRARIEAASSAGADAIFDAAQADHANLFDRASFTPAETRQPEEAISDRLEAAFRDPSHPLSADPGLAGVLFDVGRYLMIASSRPGGLPPTLQGIWNNSLRPPWSSNYTLNINAQMNHWSTHSTNLSETAEPFADFVNALSKAGRNTARRLYDAPGWVAHHNTDQWLFSSPVGDGHGAARWSHWPMAGPWLVRCLWDAIEFGADDAAAARLWPIARGAAEFALHWQHQEDGRWVTNPATSPENTYWTAGGDEAAIDISTAMDEQLLVDLFDILDALATRTGHRDDTIVRAARDRRSILPVHPEITADGVVREWSADRIEVDPQHRHISSLYGLYPGPGCWAASSRDAAAKTLAQRGDESTGWSLVWKMALWARLGRGDKVGDLLALIFREASDQRGLEAGGLYPNMFAAHPPFQIDANLGFPGALTECVLQSHDGIEFLPALPPQLSTGSARGLVARPGIEIDLEWREGQLIRAELRPRKPTSVRLRYRARNLEIDLDVPRQIIPSDFS